MRWLAIVLFSATCWAQTIQPTRTREKCDSDLAAWQGENDTLSYKSLSAERLNDRSKELLYCEIDYPDVPQKQNWIKQRVGYSDAMTLRYQKFLERHKLWNVFLAEDEHGER